MNKLIAIGIIIFGYVVLKFRDVDYMARTAWGEARGDGVESMRAVMHTMKNRVALQTWFGKTMYEVISKDKQYSAWNKGDPNRIKMIRLDSSDTQYKQAHRMAMKIVAGLDADPTAGATHYHTNDMMPYWAKSGQLQETARIGNHIFYKKG